MPNHKTFDATPMLARHRKQIDDIIDIITTGGKRYQLGIRPNCVNLRSHKKLSAVDNVCDRRSGTGHISQ